MPSIVRPSAPFAGCDMPAEVERPASSAGRAGSGLSGGITGGISPLRPVIVRLGIGDGELAGAATAASAAASLGATVAPQEPQNCVPGASVAPHCEQLSAPSDSGLVIAPPSPRRLPNP